MAKKGLMTTCNDVDNLHNNQARGMGLLGVVTELLTQYQLKTVRPVRIRYTPQYDENVL